MSVREFEGFSVSDWERYGLKSQNPSSREGRVYIPLDQFKGGTKIGITVGGSYGLSDKAEATLDAQFGFGKGYAYALMIGANYNFLQKEKFSWGINPKVGYAGALADIGTVQLLRGYTAPVILSQGTFSNGDKLAVQTGGFAFQLTTTPTFKVTENAEIRLQAGYTLSTGGAAQINVTPSGSEESFTIDMSSKAVVKSNGSSTQAGIKPTASISGITASVSVAWSF